MSTVPRRSLAIRRATQALGTALALVSISEPLWVLVTLPKGSYTTVNVALGSLVAFVGIAKRIKRAQLYKVMMLLAFTGYLAISLLWTPAPLYGREKVLYFTARTVVPAVGLILAGGLRVSGIVRSLTWIGVVVLALRGLHGPLAEGAFKDVNGIWVARFVGVCALAAYSVASRTNVAARTRLIAWVEFLALTVLVVTQGYMGPTIALVGSLVMLQVLERATLSRVALRSAIALVCIAVVGIYLALSPEAWENVSKFNPLLDGNTLARARFLGRLAQSEPRLSWVPGHGAGSAAWWLVGQDVRAYPHNVPFEILFETGIPGFLLFSFFIHSGFASLRRTMDTVEATFMRAYGVFALLNAMASGDIAHNPDMWLFTALSTAYCLYASRALTASTAPRASQVRRDESGFM